MGEEEFDDWDTDASAEARERAYQRAEAKGLIRYLDGRGMVRGRVIAARDLQPAATSRTTSGRVTVGQAVQEHRLQTNDYGPRSAMVSYVARRCGMTEQEASRAIANDAVARHIHPTTF